AAFGRSAGAAPRPPPPPAPAPPGSPAPREKQRPGIGRGPERHNGASPCPRAAGGCLFPPPPGGRKGEVQCTARARAGPGEGRGRGRGEGRGAGSLLAGPGRNWARNGEEASGRATGRRQLSERSEVHLRAEPEQLGGARSSRRWRGQAGPVRGGGRSPLPCAP